MLLYIKVKQVNPARIHEVAERALAPLNDVTLYIRKSFNNLFTYDFGLLDMQFLYCTVKPPNYDTPSYDNL